MPRKLEDIVKIKNSSQQETKKKMFSLDDLGERPSPRNFPEPRQEGKGKSRNTLWFVALISVVALFFAISFLFSSAKVTINPQTKDFVLNKVITATKSSKAEGLSFDLVVLSGEEKKEVTAGEEKDYLEYAKGSVLIYNTFSSSPQLLAEGTRLLGSNDKIYKTKSKITLPGMSKKGVPGKINVDIYAEKAGEEYNSVPLDLNVLGFKGTSKYSKIYARSVGEISGGLKGKSRQVSDVDKVKIKKELTDTLFAKLFAKAKNQTPKEFVLLKDATFLSVEEEDITKAETEGNFTVTLKGTFSGILFSKEKLTKEITKAYSDANNGVLVSDVYISNIETLSFSNTDKGIADLNNAEDITFTLSGTPKIVWRVDEEKLMSDLLGRKKKDFSLIMSGYPNIDSADLSIKPIWQGSFPNKSKDIKIIVNYPN